MSKGVGECQELGEKGLRVIFLTVLDLRKATEPYGGRCGAPQVVTHLHRQLVMILQPHVALLPSPQPRAPALSGAPVCLPNKSLIVPKNPERGDTGQQLPDSRMEGTFLGLRWPLDLSSWQG